MLSVFRQINKCVLFEIGIECFILSLSLFPRLMLTPLLPFSVILAGKLYCRNVLRCRKKCILKDLYKYLAHCAYLCIDRKTDVKSKYI